MVSLTVNGSVRCINGSSSSIAISLQKLSVVGVFVCGTDGAPFNGTIDITLVGTRSSAENDIGGAKGLVVYEGATLQLHGSKSVSWTRLSATAQAGSSQITVSDDVDWSAGDQLVIATTDGYGDSIANSNELVSIASISGRVIQLTAPLAYTHRSELLDLPFSTQANPLALRRQAEVGLISRNILIQGDASSRVSSFGAHVTGLNGSFVYVSGVQIDSGGQAADGTATYRYPFEWDSAQDAVGQYFKQSSITNSNFGCVGVRGTNNVGVSSNLCYNFAASGFVLDSGSETGNTFDQNLGILGTSTAQASVVSDAPVGFTNSVFLSRNPTNTFTNNVAVASYGAGYWLQFQNATPGNTPYGNVSNNQAHSVFIGYTSCPNDGSAGTPTGISNWLVSSLSVYGAIYGVLPCGDVQYFTDTVLVETKTGFQSYSTHYLTNTAFVGHTNSDKYVNDTAAVRLLSSGWVIERALFLNYDSQRLSVFTPASAPSYNPATKISKVSLVNTTYLFADPTNSTFFEGYDGQFSTVVYDSDGSLTGHPNYTMVTSHPLMIDSSCFPLTGSFGYACPYTYLDTKLSFDALGLPIAAIGRYSLASSRKRAKYSPVESPESFATRGKRAATAANASAVFFPTSASLFYRWSAIVNSDYVYTFLMPLTAHKLSNLSMPYSHNGDTLALEITGVLFVSGITGATQAASCDAVYASKSVQSYFFDAAAKRLCVRLVATVRADPSAELGYTSSISLSAESAQVTVGQPPAPYSDSPNALPTNCTCISAMVDYWTRYNSSVNIDIDPVYHYMKYGAAQKYSWNCLTCSANANYETEDYCRTCDAARGNYTALHPEIVGKIDPYDHYILYQLTLGYAYHCDYCAPPPPPTTGEILTYRKYNKGLAAGLGAVVGIAICVALFAVVMLCVRWTGFSKHGSFYCAVIICGVILSEISALIVLPEPTDSLCIAFPWFLGVGFTLVYGCLFIKTWALYKVWRKAEQFKKTKLTPFYILKGIGIYLILEIILLIVWTVIDPPEAKYRKMVDDTYQLQCRTKHITFWVIFIASKGVWLVFGAVLSILTRGVVSDFNHSKSIAYAIYNIVALLIIGIPLAVSLQSIPGGTLIIEIAVIVIAYTFTLVSLFFDIWYGIFYSEHNNVAMRVRSVTRTTSNMSSQNTGSKGSKDSKDSHSHSHSDPNDPTAV